MILSGVYTNWSLSLQNLIYFLIFSSFLFNDITIFFINKDFNKISFRKSSLSLYGGISAVFSFPLPAFSGLAGFVTGEYAAMQLSRERRNRERKEREELMESVED